MLRKALHWLNTAEGDCLLRFDALMRSRRQDTGAEISESVRAIIADVRSRGDAALIDYTARFDRQNLTSATIRMGAQEIEHIASQCPAEVVRALEFAAKRIIDYHEMQLPKGWEVKDAYGNRLGMRWHKVDAAGIYVPGGKASYPSSVLMNAIPARVAGVERIAMVVPMPQGEINPAVIMAAKLAGVKEIYRIGGAQAIAALAYGTASIPPVNVIVGPGNAYVAEAKRQVFGVVGIDMVAGPSEIVVVADGTVSPAWIAADLLSQAEHDELAQSILISTDEMYAEQVVAALESQLETLPRKAIAQASLQRYGLVVIASDKQNACDIANRAAGEHLELAVSNPESWEPLITHAGAVFVGGYTPEAIGDYVAGPSHVLPTTQSAAFASGLSVYHFMKKTSVIGCTAEGFAALQEAASILANCEGLHAHALSVNIRN